MNLAANTAANTKPTNKYKAAIQNPLSPNETVLFLCTDPYISQKMHTQAYFRLTGKLPRKRTPGKQAEETCPSPAKYCFLPVITAQKEWRLLLVWHWLTGLRWWMGRKSPLYSPFLLFFHHQHLPLSFVPLTAGCLRILCTLWFLEKKITFRSPTSACK